MTTVGQTDEKPTGRTLFGHPIGLANLFGVELWERFSFYGMLTILGYYLYYSVTEGGLELPKTTATGIVGAYGGLVYLSTVLGGWIADRVLGMERTVFYGGVVVMCRPHRARDHPRPGRRRRGPRARRARLGCIEGECVVAARHPVREG